MNAELHSFRPANNASAGTLAGSARGTVAAPLRVLLVSCFSPLTTQGPFWPPRLSGAGSKLDTHEEFGEDVYSDLIRVEKRLYMVFRMWSTFHRLDIGRIATKTAAPLPTCSRAKPAAEAKRT